MDIILNGKIEPVEVGFDNLEELQEYVDLDTKSVETVIVTPDNLKSCRQMRAYYNGQARLIHENMKAFQAKKSKTRFRILRKGTKQRAKKSTRGSARLNINLTRRSRKKLRTLMYMSP